MITRPVTDLGPRLTGLGACPTDSGPHPTYFGLVSLVWGSRLAGLGACPTYLGPVSLVWVSRLADLGPNLLIWVSVSPVCGLSVIKCSTLPLQCHL
ncbi:hypothetical protein FKM82_022430 [Ascaphus truei]